MVEITVKYKNELNRMDFSNFTKHELNFFFTICSKVKYMKNDYVVFDFKELKKLSQYKSTSKRRFILDIERTRDKLMELKYIEYKGISSKVMAIIISFEILSENEIVKVQIHPEYEYLFNNLNANFTQFELQEFVELNSVYSKTIYRFLKQFNSTGFFTLSMKEFREILDIPNSYRMTNIQQKVIDPIKKEMSKIFEPFIIKKIKVKGRVERIEFYYKPKEPIDFLYPKVPMFNWLE